MLSPLTELWLFEYEALTMLHEPAAANMPVGPPLPVKLALRSTSRCVPGVLPACGSVGAPVWACQASSCCNTRPSSPAGSPLRPGLGSLFLVGTGAVAPLFRSE